MWFLKFSFEETEKKCWYTACKYFSKRQEILKGQENTTINRKKPKPMLLRISNLMKNVFTL